MTSFSELFTAHQERMAALEQQAYMQGWRWGWVCGAVAGIALGALCMWAALELGRMAGA